MQLGRCPVCHHRLSLQAILQDEASSELLGVLAKQPKDIAVPLVSYLGLFRPAKQDLTNVRALKLAREVLAMGGPLATALEKTVDSIMKQRAGQTNVQPLANHNYLKQVLETLGSPAQKTGHQRPPGEVQGAKHKAAEVPRQIPADARAMMQSCGVKTNKSQESKK